MSTRRRFRRVQGEVAGGAAKTRDRGARVAAQDPPEPSEHVETAGGSEVSRERSGHVDHLGIILPKIGESTVERDFLAKGLKW